MVTPAALGLGPLEAAIMTVMWQADDWLTTREIQDRIDYPTRAYTSVATVATNLERKGHLRKRRSPAANHPGPRRWQYHAAVPHAEHDIDVRADVALLILKGGADVECGAQLHTRRVAEHLVVTADEATQPFGKRIDDARQRHPGRYDD